MERMYTLLAIYFHMTSEEDVSNMERMYTLLAIYFHMTS